MWNSIVEMLVSLNENCNYIVLRNYEQFEEKRLISGHEDVDLLCDNAEKVISLLQAENKVQGDNVHLKVNICNEKIDLDLRCVGDGYYDKKWELNMLDRKVKYHNLFYVPDSETYFYSLAYHALFHKSFLKQDYIDKLNSIGQKSGIHFEIQNLKEQVIQYMDKNQLEDKIMGELIKKVGKIHIRDTEFDVELNEAGYPGLDKVIHIQNEKFRLLLTQKEFIQFATTILAAKDNFDYYKGKGSL